MRLLLAHGADVNPRDDNGHTPTHATAENDHTDMVDLLKRHGGKT